MLMNSFAQGGSVPALGVLIAAAGLAAFAKLYWIGVDTGEDYPGYLFAAKYFQGLNAEPPPFRILKPLAPMLVAALQPAFGYQYAFIVQAVFFYLALVIAMYLFAVEFFDDWFPATLATALVAFSYPVLKYGLDLRIETGAWFFYVLSLWLTLRFIKRPTIGVLLVNAVVIAIAFLWKEYAVVSGAALALTVVLHPTLTLRNKAVFLGAFAAVFLAANVPWQIFMLSNFHYSYFDFYTSKNLPGFRVEYTLKNLVKSTAGVLALGWVTVPLGLMRIRTMDSARKQFLYAALPPPFIAFGSGHVESRLFYVLGPPFAIVSIIGMGNWHCRRQAVFVAAAVAANIAWLVISYSVTL
jgi:hypothetical protein